MTKLHLVFTPYLWFYDEIGHFIKEELYPTGDTSVDLATQDFTENNLKSFLTGLEGNFGTLNYKFENNTLHAWMETWPGLTDEELAYELYGMDPEGLGPDGWMSGDINVAESIQFVPRVNKVYIIEGDIEKEIDLTNLPLQH